MNHIIQLCQKHCSGLSKLQPNQQYALRLYLFEPSNARQIMNLAKESFQFLVCFNAITRQKMRTGEYFGINNKGLGQNKESLERQEKRAYFLQQMLTVMSQVPEHDDLTKKNMYLSVFGTLLGNYINFCQRQEYSKFFLQQVFNNIKTRQLNSAFPLLQIYQLSKIIQSTLQQIKILQNSYTSPYNLYHNLWRFVQMYCSIISQNIVQSFSALAKILKEQKTDISNIFQVIKRIVSSLQSCMDSMNQLLGFKEIIDPKDNSNQNQFHENQIRKNFCKIYLAIFYKQQHVLIYVQSISSLIPIIMAINTNQHQKQTTLCSLTNILENITNIILSITRSSKDKDYQNRHELTITFFHHLYVKYLLPFMSMIINQQSMKQIQNYFYNENLTSPLLRILQKTICYIVSYQHPVSQNYIQDKQNVILQFCQICLKSFSPNYWNVQQCAIILCFQALDTLKYNTLQQIYKEKHGDQDHCNNIGKFFDKKTKYFFKKYVLQRLVQPVDVALMNLQKQEEQNDIINYQQYIKSCLVVYFRQLVLYGPKFMNYEIQQLPVQRQIDHFQNNPDDQQTQINHKFILFDDSDSESISYNKQQLQIQLDTSHTRDNQKLFQDFECLMNLISSIECQYQRDLPELIKTPSCNNYINTQTLPLLVCLYQMFNTFTNSHLKAQLLFQLFGLADVFELKAYIQDDIQSLHRIQLNFCRFYLHQKFMQKILPGSYIIQGPLASDLSILAQNQYGKIYVDYILETLQSISLGLMNTDETSKLLNNKIQSLDIQQLIQDLVAYGLFILQNIAVKLSERADQIDQDPEGRDEVKTCEQLINFIYQHICDLEYVNSFSNFKLYCLAGLLTDTFNFTSIYQTYKKLKQESLQKQFNLTLYFSGLTGLLKQCSQQKKLQIILELCYQDLVKIKQGQFLEDIDQDLLEVFIPFLKYLFSKKMFKQSHDGISFHFQQILHQIIQKCLIEALMIPDLRKQAEQVYKNYNKIDNFYIKLLELSPHFQYPISIIQVYFKNLDRVKTRTIQILFNYVHLKINYLIQLLNFYIQNRDDEGIFSIFEQKIPSLIDINHIANNFTNQALSNITELSGIIHYFVHQNTVENIIDRIMERITDIKMKRYEQMGKLLKDYERDLLNQVQKLNNYVDKRVDV